MPVAAIGLSRVFTVQFASADRAESDDSYTPGILLHFFRYAMFMASRNGTPRRLLNDRFRMFGIEYVSCQRR